jgi:N6-adenosine-specific RNA methylase IME4
MIIGSPGKLYDVIYADPPWRYQVKNMQGCAENHYPTMSIEEIAALPVQRIISANSILFMWATWPLLFSEPGPIDVIKGWGFKYKTCAFVWVKANKSTEVNQTMFFAEDITGLNEKVGLGRWVRGNTEFCLLATHGSPKRLAANVHQIIYEKIERHSAKPDEARKRIVQLVGDLPRIELFARIRRPGWDVWGNQV